MLSTLKPSGTVYLNKNHWAYPNIVYCGVFGQWHKELVSGNEFELRGAAYWEGVGPSGEVFQTYDNTDNTTYVKPSDRVYEITNKMTLMFVGNISSASDWGGMISVPYHTGSWTAPYASIAFMNRGSSISGAAIWHTVGSGERSDSLGGFLIPSEDHVYVGQLDTVNITAGAKWYRDGVFHSEDNSYSGDIDWGDKNSVCHHGNDYLGNNTSENFTGKSYLAVIMDRTLSTQEHASLGQNPFSILSIKPRTLYTFVPFGSGTTFFQTGNTIAVGVVSFTDIATFVRVLAHTALGVQTVLRFLQLTKALSTAAPVVVVKQISVTKGVTTSATPLIVKMVQTAKSMATTGAVTFSSVAVLGKTLVNTAIGVVALVKSILLTRAITTTAPVVLVKMVQMARSTVASAVPLVIKMVRSVKAIVSVGIPVVVSLAILGKSLTNIAVGTVVLIKRILLTKVIAATAPVVLVKMVQMTRDTVTSAVPLVVKTIRTTKSIVSVGVLVLVDIATFLRTMTAVAIGGVTVVKANFFTRTLPAIAVGVVGVTTSIILFTGKVRHNAAVLFHRVMRRTRRARR